MPSFTGAVLDIQNWNTRDLLIVAALGIVPGLALLPVVYAGFAIRAAFGPVVTALYSGLFYAPGLLSLYIIRKPGAAILNGVFVALVWIPLTPFGIAVTVPTLVARVGSELAFLATGYRRYDRATLLAGGAAGGLLSLAVIYLPFSYQRLPLAVQFGLLVGNGMSGAVLGGLVPKMLADNLADTGVLSAYPIVRADGETQ